MSKTRDTGFLNNVVKTDPQGNVFFVSGSTTLLSISSSGAVTTTGVISGSNALTASYAQNSELLDNLDSTSFVFTSSYNTDSSSVSTRVTRIEGNYATTGSNVFLGAQTVCANITSTGTIIAQTLNVQQVTSSVVYSSGSNVFGCSLSNTQQFTGSVTMTGSLNVTGNASFANCITACNAFIQVPSTAAVVDILRLNNPAVTNSGTRLKFENGYGDLAALRVTHMDNGSLADDGQIEFQTAQNAVLGTRMTILNTGVACFACQICAPNIISSGTICSTGNTCIGGATVIAGCLGIGTLPTQSGTRLQVAGITDIWSSANTLLRLNHDGTRGVIETFTGGGYSSTAINPNGGNVGIGTTSPAAELQVNKNSDVTIAMSNCISVTSGNRGTLAFYNCATSTVALIRAAAVTDNVGTELQFHTRPAGGSLTQAMTIGSNGAVGIGTINTGAILTICNPAQSSTSTVTWQNGGRVKGNLYSDTGGVAIYAGEEFNGAVMYMVANDQIQFRICSSTPKLLLTNAGCIACFAGQICAPRINVSNTSTVLLVEGTATNGEASINLSGKNSSGTVRNAIFKYDNVDVIRLGTSSNIGMQFETNDVARFRLANTGIACFACQVCTAGILNTSFRISNARVNGTWQEWVAQGITLTNNSAIALFCINSQYDNLIVDLAAWIDQGAWSPVSYRFNIGYNVGTSYVAGLGAVSAICGLQGGTTYNETWCWKNCSGGNISNSAISLRIFGRATNEEISTGGRDLIVSSYLTRVS